MGTRPIGRGTKANVAEGFGLFNLKASQTFTRSWRDPSLNKRLKLMRVSGCLRVVVFTGCSDKDPTKTLRQSGPYISLLHAVRINYGMLGVGPMELDYSQLCDHGPSSVRSSRCPRMHPIILGPSLEEEVPR